MQVGTECLSKQPLTNQKLRVDELIRNRGTVILGPRNWRWNKVCIRMRKATSNHIINSYILWIFRRNQSGWDQILKYAHTMNNVERHPIWTKYVLPQQQRKKSKTVLTKMIYSFKTHNSTLKLKMLFCFYLSHILYYIVLRREPRLKDN